jgi:hypothetical protein
MGATSAAGGIRLGPGHASYRLGGKSVDWSEYVSARVASMTTAYGVSAMITVGSDGLDEVARGALWSFGCARLLASRIHLIFTASASLDR